MLSNWPQGYAGILIALSSGLFGASFFMLARLQTRISAGTLDDVEKMWTYPMLMLRSFVGIGGALILYFFFQTGLLQGTIWPDLASLDFQQIFAWKDTPLRVPGKNLALLIVWSFLAGYSETLVPSIMERTEARAADAG